MKASDSPTGTGEVRPCRHSGSPELALAVVPGAASTVADVPAASVVAERQPLLPPRTGSELRDAVRAPCAGGPGSTARRRTRRLASSSPSTMSFRPTISWPAQRQDLPDQGPQPVVEAVRADQQAGGRRETAGQEPAARVGRCRRPTGGVLAQIGGSFRGRLRHARLWREVPALSVAG